MLGQTKWTKEEDERLSGLRNELRKNCWSEIARILNKEFSGKFKNGKQCRERYLNYIQISSKDTDLHSWTSEESEILFAKFLALGSKWAQISTFLPHKSENMCKNRFYSSIRKFLRLLNTHIDKKIRNKSKSITIQSVNRLLNFSEQIYQANDDRRHMIQDLKRDMLTQIQREDEEEFDEELRDLGIRVKSFNVQNKCQLIKQFHKKKSQQKDKISLRKKYLTLSKKSKPSESESTGVPSKVNSSPQFEEGKSQSFSSVEAQDQNQKTPFEDEFQEQIFSFIKSESLNCHLPLYRPTLGNQMEEQKRRDAFFFDFFND